MARSELAMVSGSNALASKFLFEVEGRGLFGSFSRISGIKEEVEVVEMRDGADPLQVRKIPGMRKGGIVTLERGVVFNSIDLITWLNEVKQYKDGYRRSVHIGIAGAVPPLEAAGAEFGSPRAVAREIIFDRAWPTSYELGDLDATKSEIEVEVLTLAFDSVRFFGATSIPGHDAPTTPNYPAQGIAGENTQKKFVYTGPTKRVVYTG
jgi:phage tail-like protein